jgi:putative tryptophan/tyrosine transport system substrate-binding protein
MRRREFIGVISGAAAWPVTTRAQQLQRTWRVGILGSASAPLSYQMAFRQALRDLGYVEGQNLFFEDRTDSLPSHAVDLVKLKVDVI